MNVRIIIEVTINKGLAAPASAGRLFVILARTNNPEPRFTLGRTGLNAPQVLARDSRVLARAQRGSGRERLCFPITNLSALPAGDYFAQALFDANPDLHLADAPGNLYGKPQKIHLDPAQGGAGGWS